MPVSERLKEQTKTRKTPGRAAGVLPFVVSSSGVRERSLQYDPVVQRGEFEAARVSAQRHGGIAPVAKKGRHRGLTLVARPVSEIEAKELVDVALVPLFLLHLREVFVGVVEGAVRALGDRVEKRKLHILRHAGRVAADVKVGSAL